MKTRTIAAGMVMAAISLSCSRQEDGAGTGTVSFSVADDYLVADAVKSNVSDYTTLPSVSDFTLKITDADQVQVYSGLLSGWDSATALPVGGYKASVSYGEEGVEGFDRPYFTGEKEFSVVGGISTAVSVPASLANTIVKMSFSTSFTNYFTDYTITVTTGNGNVISFPKGETRAAFVDAYKFTLSGTMTGQGGSVKSFSKEFNSLDARTCYTVTLDATNVGSGTISVTFNDLVTIVELTDLELNE
ncbi:MAG: DUF4493 domain-containing protein [Candidatus Cryptobacteroides sp.]